MRKLAQYAASSAANQSSGTVPRPAQPNAPGNAPKPSASHIEDINDPGGLNKQLRDDAVERKLMERQDNGLTGRMNANMASLGLNLGTGIASIAPRAVQGIIGIPEFFMDILGRIPGIGRPVNTFRRYTTSIANRKLDELVRLIRSPAIRHDYEHNSESTLGNMLRSSIPDFAGALAGNLVSLGGGPAAIKAISAIKKYRLAMAANAVQKVPLRTPITAAAKKYRLAMAANAVQKVPLRTPITAAAKKYRLAMAGNAVQKVPPIKPIAAAAMKNLIALYASKQDNIQGSRFAQERELEHNVLSRNNNGMGLRMPATEYNLRYAPTKWEYQVYRFPRNFQNLNGGRGYRVPEGWIAGSW